MRVCLCARAYRRVRVQSESKKITIQATGAISWRKEDIKYRKNECFIDVIESLNLIMSNKGAILRVDVSGQVMVKAFLSGMPECKFGLNDKLLMERNAANAKKRQTAVELDDVQFHQCVKLGRFDVDRTISFVPPDGEFELMKYRTTENINLPFRVHAIVNEVGRTRVEYKVVVKATFANTLAANNVKIFIPTPTNTAAVRTREAAGKAKYKPGDNGIIWKCVLAGLVFVAGRARPALPLMRAARPVVRCVPVAFPRLRIKRF